ncbi:prepilin-type N-terminal cleavage/methylation domain-containing protein [Cerasicoccus maritimus]|uniref:prepilin-type N-terminal cleavage/methylation domain-containing protein n=1 Tax=Cerasicoccus maritimus TaxID=490089 RepID=UPI002852BA04|nr:prepilin-type N-terminal cleavage/methylation domain-containing protein [Cerasicoccus maritimus]
MTRKVDFYHRPGFTLVELIVVIGIIALLSAIFYSVAGIAKQKANTARSTSNLRQLGNATNLYAIDHQYDLPMVSNSGNNYADPPWYMGLAEYIGAIPKPGSKIAFQEGVENILYNPASEEENKIINFAPSISCAPNPSARPAINVLKTTQVIDPAKKAWLITATNSYYYNPYNALGLEYPHNGQANVLYFDGSVGLVSKAEVIERGRNLLDPRAQ